MRKSRKRLLLIALTGVGAIAAACGLFWLSLTHEPEFYRALVRLPKLEREKEAKEFVAQSLQLSNDIHNEPTWEAVFTDQQVNAWMAEDLVEHFADQLPAEIREPRVKFEVDRLTLAFELDRGAMRSVIWVVARAEVPEGNVLRLTLEKVRAGALPIPPDGVLDRVVGFASRNGLDMSWKREEGLPVVTVRYEPKSDHEAVELESVQVREGEIRLQGRSELAKGKVARLTLPSRQVLRSAFPKRNSHKDSRALPSTSALRSSTTPRS